MGTKCVSGQTLVKDLKLYEGDHIKLNHMFQGLVEGHIHSYEGNILVIKKKDGYLTWANKGLITAILEYPDQN